MSFEEVANMFCTAFYQQYDQDPGSVAAFYHPAALLTFEGAAMQGADAIKEKFVNLGFKTVAHAATSIDAQPMEDGSIVVNVLGQLKTDDDPVKGFTEMFVLKKLPDGNFVIMHHIFRLAIHSLGA